MMNDVSTLEDSVTCDHISEISLGSSLLIDNIKKATSSSLSSSSGLRCQRTSQRYSQRLRFNGHQLMTSLQGSKHRLSSSSKQQSILASSQEASSLIASTSKTLHPQKSRHESSSRSLSRLAENGNAVEKLSCTFPNCSKSFRNASVLQAHLKHFHRASKVPNRTGSDALGCVKIDALPETNVATATIANTAADTAVTITVTPTPTVTTAAATLKNHIAAANSIDASNTLIGPITNNAAPGHTSKTCAIRCLCGFYEHSDKMLQCNQCMTWQHNHCVHSSQYRDPSRYLCFVCLHTYRLRGQHSRINEDFFVKNAMFYDRALNNLCQLTEQKASIIRGVNACISQGHQAYLALLRGRNCGSEYLDIRKKANEISRSLRDKLDSFQNLTFSNFYIPTEQDIESIRAKPELEPLCSFLKELDTQTNWHVN